MKTLTVPSGATVHTIQVEVGPVAWSDVVNLAGPDNHPLYRVNHLGAYYRGLESSGLMTLSLIQLAPDESNFERADYWARSERLLPTLPHHVFSITHVPFEIDTSAKNSTIISETTGYRIDNIKWFSDVWFRGTRRGPFCHRLSDLNGRSGVWFVYLHP